MIRLFRGLDVKFILALVALMVSATICWGFVQRGQHITEAERSVTQLSHQVGSLVDENRRLHQQIAENDRDATWRARQAAREREALRVELVRLVEFLRSQGLHVPARDVTGPSYAAPPSAPAQQPARGGGESPPGGQPSSSPSPPGPGNSGGHSHGHHTHHQHGHSPGHGPAPLLPPVPALPPLPLL